LNISGEIGECQRSLARRPYICPEEEMKHIELMSKWRELLREAAKGEDTKRLKDLISHINVLAKPIRDRHKRRREEGNPSLKRPRDFAKSTYENFVTERPRGLMESSQHVGYKKN
jgi:hypothetical protein